MRSVNKELIIKEARKELARRNYKDYIEYVHEGLYKHSKHTLFLCNRLEKLTYQKNQRIIVTLPPRHSKSMTFSETYPSYYLSKLPNNRVIEVSYGYALAKGFGRKNKQKINAFGKELFEIELSRLQFASDDWEIEGYRGGMVSAGIGGAITGKGADLLIIDDPIKNQEEALSETIRNKVWEEYRRTLVPRVQADGNIIIILTRWHEDDIVGRVLSGETKSDWDVINLPAIAEENDLLGRKVGEALAPILGYDEEWAKTKKKEVGSRAWASLYQQRPSPADGNIFKREWWRYYQSLPPSFSKIVLSWDFTFKNKKDSDFVVGQAWGELGPDRYLIDQVRAKKDFVGSLKMIRNFVNKYPTAHRKLIEDKANGSAIISVLQSEFPGIIPIEPYGSKEARAYAVTPFVEAGNVYIPVPAMAPWVNDYVEEFASFPNGANDDQVDCTTQFLNDSYNGLLFSFE